MFWKDSMDFMKIIQNKEEVVPLKQLSQGAKVFDRKPQTNYLRNQGRR